MDKNNENNRHRAPLKQMLVLLVFAAIVCSSSRADDGYGLWLRYQQVDDPTLLLSYRTTLRSLIVAGNSETADIVRKELRQGLESLLRTPVPVSSLPLAPHSLVVGTPESLSPGVLGEATVALQTVGREGFVITSRNEGQRSFILIAANTEVGALYGSFHFLRLLQTGQTLHNMNIVSFPRIQFRLLNHWDNLDGSVERGYAGKSLWKWNELPGTIDQRYRDYARANASIGINGAVLNNVNANPEILRPDYLKKVAALANVFRPYGIRIFLSVNFSSPLSAQFEIEGNRRGGIGDLATSDPHDPLVREWWKVKVREIYELIPDFGGFLVKANSEGMPGPQDYGRTHAQGANMLAEALAPYGGVVMWRAFVYNADVDPDRTKRAYKEFVPLDGQFHPNVFVQVKNGPLDFQPREPVNPIFGAMPKTSLMLEVQITQEYLGHSTHLVYLAPMWKEYLDFDLHVNGSGSTLASVVDGTLHGYRMTGIAGVANTGSDRNWTGHFFGQANWYAFGRLAWDHRLSPEQIADEWIRMTFGLNPTVDSTISAMMIGSWEACVNYMTPLGLHHIMQEHVHYGPEPGLAKGREDWTSVYYHRAGEDGIGYNRSSTGSNAVSQYFSPVRELFDDVTTCPEKYLLWFHHVPWTHRMKSGRTLWEEMNRRYFAGTQYVARMQEQWGSLQPFIDAELFKHVSDKLQRHYRDAVIWRDTCLTYFQKFSRMPIIPTP